MSEKQVKVLASEVHDVSAETVKLSNVVAKKTKKISNLVGGETKMAHEAMVASTQELATNIGTESQKLTENNVVPIVRINDRERADVVAVVVAVAAVAVEAAGEADEVIEYIGQQAKAISEVVARESVKLATNVGSTTKAVPEVVVASTVKKAPTTDIIDKKEPDTNRKDKVISFADEQRQQEDDKIFEKLAASKSNANTNFRLSKLACAVVENPCGDDLTKAVVEEKQREEEKEKDLYVDVDDEDDEIRDDNTFDWSAADYHSGVDVDELTLSFIPMVSDHEDSDDDNEDNDDDDDDSTIGSHSTTNTNLLLDLGEVQMSSDAEDDLLDTDVQGNVDGQEVTVHDYKAIVYTKKGEAKNTIYSSSTSNVRQIETREGIEVINSCVHPSDKSNEENEAEDKKSEDAIATDKEGQVEAREYVEDDSAIGIGGQDQIHDTGNGCEIETRDSVEEILGRLNEAGTNAQIETREGIEVINSCVHPSDKTNEENEAEDKNSEDAIAADKEGQVETREYVEDDSEIGIGGQGLIHDTGNGCEIETRDSVEEMLDWLDEAGNNAQIETRDGIEVINSCVNPSDKSNEENEAEDKNSEDAVAADKEGQVETREDVEDDSAIGIGGQGQIHDTGNGCKIETRDSVEEILGWLDEAGNNAQIETREGIEVISSCVNPSDKSNEKNEADDKISEDAVAADKEGQVETREDVDDDSAIGIGGQGQIHDTGNGCEIETRGSVEEILEWLKPKTANAFAAHVAPSPNELMKRRNKGRHQFQKPSSEYHVNA